MRVWITDVDEAVYSRPVLLLQYYVLNIYKFTMKCRIPVWMVILMLGGIDPESWSKQNFSGTIYQKELHQNWQYLEKQKFEINIMKGMVL